MHPRLLSVTAALILSSVLFAQGNPIKPVPTQPAQPPTTIHPEACCGNDPPVCPPSNPNCQP